METTLKQFAKLANRCKTNKQVTRLWNYADHQTDCCEAMFEILLNCCSFAFRDKRYANSINFAY